MKKVSIHNQLVNYTFLKSDVSIDFVVEWSWSNRSLLMRHITYFWWTVDVSVGFTNPLLILFKHWFIWRVAFKVVAIYTHSSATGLRILLFANQAQSQDRSKRIQSNCCVATSTIIQQYNENGVSSVGWNGSKHWEVLNRFVTYGQHPGICDRLLVVDICT